MDLSSIKVILRRLTKKPFGATDPAASTGPLLLASASTWRGRHQRKGFCQEWQAIRYCERQGWQLAAHRLRTEWAEIDCETGVELDSNKARKLGDNVIDLFGSI